MKYATVANPVMNTNARNPLPLARFFIGGALRLFIATGAVGEDGAAKGFTGLPGFVGFGVIRTPGVADWPVAFCARKPSDRVPGLGGFEDGLDGGLIERNIQGGCRRAEISPADRSFTKHSPQFVAC